MPASLKALDRLIGAAIDIPVAWLNQKKAKIEAQTNSFSLVEAAITKGVVSIAENDPALAERAADVLIRKAYRQQSNREAVATAMLADLRITPIANEDDQLAEVVELDDDWLNVFERYAEDASTQRMQALWGRVLAGEIRKPGRYAMRTLRFLSEFSQADGLTFAEFSKNAFCEFAPDKLVKPDGLKDIRSLIYLESSGLIQGASGIGLTITRTFNGDGHIFIVEGKTALFLKGKPSDQIITNLCILTPLGQELLSLLPGRNVRECARVVAEAIRCPAINSAYLGTVQPDGKFLPLEVLWQETDAEIIEPSDNVNSTDV